MVLTTLRREHLSEILSSAEERLNSILSDEPLSVRMGGYIGGWRSSVYLAYSSFHSGISNEEAGNIERPDYVVLSTVLPLETSNLPLGFQYSSLREIVNYLAASYILGESSSAFVPRVKGHITLDEIPERNRKIEGVVLEYVPSVNPSQIDAVSEEEYFEHLGRDIARFVISGMVNVPRHLRPNYDSGSFRTAMIDLDPYDSGTFRWNTIPATEISASVMEESERTFVSDTFTHFVPDEYFLNISMRPRVSKLHEAYFSSFVAEVERILGSRTREAYYEIASMSR